MTWTRRRLVFAALPLLLLAFTYAVATADIRSHDGRVLRSVSLGQANVGSMDLDELDVELDRLSSFVETAPVYIQTPGAAYQIDAERLGLTLDRSATRAAVMAAGREGTGVLRPLRWAGALFSPRDVEPVLSLDPIAAEAGLRAVSKTISVQPGEPTLLLRNGRLELEPGTPGSILDVERLLRDLSSSLPNELGEEIVVDAFTTTDAVVDVDIQALVDQVNGATTRPIDLLVGELQVVVPQADFRSWFRLDLQGEDPVGRLDTERMYAWINAAAGIAEVEIDTRNLVVEGERIRLPASNAVRCCRAEAADEVLASVLAGRSPIEVALINDDVTPLVDLGIAELMGQFTTEHPSGEARVINIQRMADIVHGAVIEPGETFSLNGYVGERTTDRGFVPAGVIYNGVFTDDVGGGVSQFATTLFNAAFFGGLDLMEYQSHSIYIDRYPYGREATVNYPGIDLKIRNPTEFPIVIWTEYTPGSISVKLFGTAVVSARQTGQTTEPVDQCTRVRTERTRTWFDGTIDVDTVGAVYQPSEGYGCDGRPTTPPPDCADGEALIDTSNDGFGDLCAPLDVICPAGTVPVDENDDQVIDYCDTQTCPDDTRPADTDGDNVVDQCLQIEVLPEPTPEPADETTDG